MNESQHYYTCTHRWARICLPGLIVSFNWGLQMCLSEATDANREPGNVV